MKLRTTLLFFLGLIVGASSLARAQDSEQLSSDFVKVYTVVSYVATVKGFCDGAVPASKAANTAALGAWKTANNMAQIESLTVTFTRKLPSVSDSLSAIRSKMLVKVKQSAAGREANYCGQLPGLLKDPATQVGQKYKAEIAQLAQTMSGTPAATTMPPQSGSSTAAGTLKLESGHYDCTKYVVRTASGEAFALKYDSVPKNSAAPWGTFDLFANGEYSYESKTSIELPSSPLDWPKTMGRYVTYFNNEANVNQIDWKTGGYGDYNGRFERSYTTSDDKPNYYKTGKDGRLVVILDTQGRGDWINTVECHRKGSTVRKSPTQMMQAAETAETYLQPARVRAAPPPGGSGGLQGVYLGERPLYLSKSGYSSYDWRWGFDRLDCTRALIPGAPLKKCGSYQVKGRTLVMDGESQPFQKRPSGELVIGDGVYVPVAPMKNLRLEGSYTYSYSSQSGGFAAGGAKTIKFGKDGKFSFSTDSFLAGGNADAYLTNISEGDNPNAGTYSLSGYSIALSFNTGLKVNYSFIPDPGSQAFYLLGRRYSLDK